MKRLDLYWALSKGLRQVLVEYGPLGEDAEMTRSALNPVGARKLVALRGLWVLAAQAAQTIAPHHPLADDGDRGCAGPSGGACPNQQPNQQCGRCTSCRFTTHLVASGIDASIGTIGDALDNALMESTIGLYKTELIKRGGPWRSLAQVELATAEWVDWSTPPASTRASGTSHQPSTNRRSTLNTSPARWLEPTTEGDVPRV